MRVKDVITFATTSELKQLSVAQVAPDDANRSSNIKALIGYINQGVIELYKRFALSTQTQTLANLVDGASYTMASDYLHLRYARAVYTDNPDYKPDIPINDEFSDISLFTPTPFTITVTKDDEKYANIGSATIVYTAIPALVTQENNTIPLAYQFLEALLQYMAYKAHSSLPQNNNAENNNIFWLRFEAACRRIEREGLYTQDYNSNYKLCSRGYP